MDKKLILISHTHNSFQFFQKGMGEVLNVEKLASLLNSNGFQTSQIIDFYSLFGRKSARHNVNKLAAINDHLAWLGQALIEDHSSHISQRALRRLRETAARFLENVPILALTYDWNIAALLTAGIAKIFPLIAKSYVPPLGLKINGNIYGSSSLVVSECLMANLLGPLCGIPPWKMVYLPHHYPERADEVFAMPEEIATSMKLQYLKQIASRSGKEFSSAHHPVVVGISSRFKEGKHIEFVIEAVERCYQEGLNVVCVLKGGYDDVALGGAAFKRRINSLMERVSSKPWFFWDREFTPFPDVLKIYRIFDLCVLVSGTEGGSNSVVEFMSVGRPCLLLEENTNPFLFKGAVAWVKPTGQCKYGRTHCRVPDMKDLYLKLKELIKDENLRLQLGKKARDEAVKRFHPAQTIERMPLILNAAKCFHEGGKDAHSYRMKILDQLQRDIQLYQIPMDITVHEVFSIQFPEFVLEPFYHKEAADTPIFTWN